jgi:hypothetical protein
MRLFRCFEEGELEARSASGEGSLGGPPTTTYVSTFRMGAAWLALLEARELRRSLGGGMGSGDDMADGETRSAISLSYQATVRGAVEGQLSYGRSGGSSGGVGGGDGDDGTERYWQVEGKCVVALAVEAPERRAD